VERKKKNIEIKTSNTNSSDESLDYFNEKLSSTKSFEKDKEVKLKPIKSVSFKNIKNMDENKNDIKFEIQVSNIDEEKSIDQRVKFSKSNDNIETPKEEVKLSKYINKYKLTKSNENFDFDKNSNSLRDLNQKKITKKNIFSENYIHKNDNIENQSFDSNGSFSKSNSINNLVISSYPVNALDKSNNSIDLEQLNQSLYLNRSNYLNKINENDSIKDTNFSSKEDSNYFDSRESNPNSNENILNETQKEEIKSETKKPKKISLIIKDFDKVKEIEKKETIEQIKIAKDNFESNEISFSKGDFLKIEKYLENDKKNVLVSINDGLTLGIVPLSKLKDLTDEEVLFYNNLNNLKTLSNRSQNNFNNFLQIIDRNDSFYKFFYNLMLGAISETVLI
jgi:hypothetical protein